MLGALVVGEYWNLGRSTEQSPSASEGIKSAAQTNVSQFTFMTSPHSVSYIWLLSGWTLVCLLKLTETRLQSIMTIHINVTITSERNDAVSSRCFYPYSSKHRKQEALKWPLTGRLSATQQPAKIIVHQHGIKQKSKTWFHKYSHHIHLHFVAELIIVHL